MANIYDKNFNKNVIQVYTQEPGFTGFKGFEFDKVDEIETILKSNMPVYDTMELKYDGFNNNTGVFFFQNNSLIRVIEMRYNGANLTGVLKTDY